MKKIDFLVVLAAFLSGCGEGGVSQQADTNRESRAPSSYEREHAWVVDPVIGSFGSLQVGIAREELVALGLPIKCGVSMEEGESYPLATVSATGAIVIECVLSDEVVYRCSSESKGLRDRAGLGVGSTLRELKTAYPAGRLLVGMENGKHANFVTDGRLMFLMDLTSIKDDCFELERCVYDEDALTVVSMVVTNV